MSSTPSPGFMLTIFYKAKDTARFDIDYYTKSHIPVTIDKWRPLGLINGYVVKVVGESEYSYYFNCTWKDQEHWEIAKAGKGDVEELKQDIKNFTDAWPTYTEGTVVDAW
ncbi:hypothetical protein BDV95DRAFT_622262 [Massariosphaeria phaeospora]|uniref:EthD domain-containing protein n=1 Tax=Massariosphaeria phaeospora TaxID=100035 RepID=A0A7C8I3V5_9PLEO|nr:hypothetical protein BDV95DRAFT_622262 [Massariosphaeria phaeospora]